MNIVARQSPCSRERTHGNQSHPTGLLVGMHIDRDSIVLHHSDQCIGQLWIMIVCVAIDKIQHLASRTPSWARKPPARRFAHEGPFRKSRQFAPLSDAERLLQKPARDPV